MIKYKFYLLVIRFIQHWADVNRCGSLFEQAVTLEVEVQDELEKQ